MQMIGEQHDGYQVEGANTADFSDGVAQPTDVCGENRATMVRDHGEKIGVSFTVSVIAAHC